MKGHESNRRQFLAILGGALAGSQLRAQQGIRMFERNNAQSMERIANSILADVYRQDTQKWGYHIGIASLQDAQPDTHNFKIIMRSEELKDCPPKDLSTYLRFQGICEPVGTGIWRRSDEESNLVYTATDEDFMRMFLRNRPEAEINNITTPPAGWSSLLPPGTPKASVNVTPADFGIRLEELIHVPLPYMTLQAEQRFITEYAVAQSDPWGMYISYPVGINEKGLGVHQIDTLRWDGKRDMPRRILGTRVDFNDGVTVLVQRQDDRTDFSGPYTKLHFSRLFPQGHAQYGYWDKLYGVDNVRANPAESKIYLPDFGLTVAPRNPTQPTQPQNPTPTTPTPTTPTTPQKSPLEQLDVKCYTEQYKGSACAAPSVDKMDGGGRLLEWTNPSGPNTSARVVIYNPDGNRFQMINRTPEQSGKALFCVEGLPSAPSLPCVGPHSAFYEFRK